MASVSSMGARRPTRTLRSVCGIFSSVASSDSLRPLARTIVDRIERGQDPVAGRRQGSQQHVARRLAAERGAGLVHQARHVAVADGRPAEGDALLRERRLEAEVGHDRPDDAARGQQALAPSSRGR